MKKIFFSAFILAVPGLFFLFYMSKTGLFMPVLDEPFSLHLSYWLGIDIEAEKALLFLSPNEKNINFDLEPVLPVSVTCEKALFSFDSSMIKRISGYGFAAAVPSSPLFVSYRARLILKKNGKRYRALKTGTLCFLTPAEKDKIPRQQQKESGIGSYPRVEYTLEDTDIGLENLKQIQEHPEAYLPPKYFYRLEEKLLDFFAFADTPAREFNHDRYYRQKWPSAAGFVFVNKRLLYQLSLLKKEAEKKFPPAKIELLCGFRSPAYNLGLLGNNPELKVPFSRHQFGDSVDMILDNDGDGIMDDLNQDGEIDIKDAFELKKLAEQAEKKSPFKGGIGWYSHHDVPERTQSPYVHFDVRGWKARWKVE